MRFIGRILRHLLWSIFSIIIFVLFVGLAKMHRDAGAYISLLANESRSMVVWSQPATWIDPFWPSDQISGDIADILDDTTNTEFSGLDVYDPAFEEDLNNIVNSSLSGNEEDFGFTTTGQVPSDAPSSPETTSKSELLNVIQHKSN